jgi:hypothetical protein
VPSEDACRRVLAAADAEQFENCFIDWIEAVEGLTAGRSSRAMRKPYGVRTIEARTRKPCGS